MNLDYRYLKAFMITAEQLNFSHAAHELGIAQSAVSRQIKLLEESIGEELIVRSSKKVLLTQKGKELYLAIHNFDQMARGVFTSEDDRPLKIGVLHGLLEDWLTPIIARYAKKHNRGLKVAVAGQDELMKSIENGLYDLVFSTINIQSDLLSSLKLFDEKLLLISKSAVDKKKLSKHTWIVYGSEDNLFKVTKERPDNIIVVESITSIVNLVKAGVGIAIVPDHAVQNPQKLIVNEVSEIQKNEIFMTSLNYKNMPARISDFVDLVKQIQN